MENIYNALAIHYGEVAPGGGGTDTRRPSHVKEGAKNVSETHAGKKRRPQESFLGKVEGGGRDKSSGDRMADFPVAGEPVKKLDAQRGPQ